MTHYSHAQDTVNPNKHLKKKHRGTWVAQLVKRLTLAFGSGHDLTVGETEPQRWALH